MPLPLPRKLNVCTPTFKRSLPVWELSGSVSSLLHFQIMLRHMRRHQGVSILLQPGYYVESCDWNLLPCLSDKIQDVFISISSRRSHETLEAVSISMPTKSPSALSVVTLEMVDGPAMRGSSSGRRGFILGLQMNSFVRSGIVLTTWHRATNLVIVRFCPFFPTLMLSQGILHLTSRVQAAIAYLLTKECALFVIRSLAALPVSNSLGLAEMEPSGVVDSSCWGASTDSTWTDSKTLLPTNSNTSCGKKSSCLANTMQPVSAMSRISRMKQRMANAPTFSLGCLTPFAKAKNSMKTKLTMNQSALFEL